MVKKFYVSIDLLGENALLNALWIELEPSSAPGTPVEGMMYYDSTGDIIKYYDDTSAFWPLYHFQSSATALGSAPADADTFLIYDADGAAGSEYRTVTYASIKPSTGYWSRDTAGTVYLYPTTTTDHIAMPLNAFVYFGVASPGDNIGADSSYIGMVDDSPDYLNIHSDLNMQLDVQDEGSIIFAFDGSNAWIMNETSSTGSLYSQATTSTIGTDANPLNTVYLDEIHFDNGGNNVVLTIATPTSGYTLKLPDADPGVDQFLITDSVDAEQLKWVTSTMHSAMTLDANIEDCFTISGQVLDADDNVTAGDIIYAPLDDSWSRLPIGTTGQMIYTTGGGLPAWGAGLVLAAGVDSLFDYTTSTRTLSINIAINSMIYASAANTLAALAPGTNGYVLYSNSGVPTWGAPNAIDLVEGYSEEFITTSASWAGAGPYTYTVDASVTAGLVISPDYGWDVHVFEDDGADYHSEVEVGIQFDYTNGDIIFHSSTKFNGHITIQKI